MRTLTKNQKIAKRGYSFIVEGKSFSQEEIFEGRKGNSFYNDIEEAIQEIYGERVESIDHASRVIHLAY